MKLIYPHVDLIQQEPGFDGMIKHIEKCGRTCYKSEDKITVDSAETFVDNLLKNKHYAMLEHGTVYLYICSSDSNKLLLKDKYEENPYSHVSCFMSIAGFIVKESPLFITTNYRVIVENGWKDDLQYICEPTKFHIPRITLKFTTNIGVTREGNRMRANSIAEESTRYCNYTKDKFGKELNICPPVWMDDTDLFALETWDEEQWISYISNNFDTSNPDFYICDDADWYGMAMAFAQIAYRNLIRLGWLPQQAREVLPLATKSDVVYTAFPHQWKHFFDLRLIGTTGVPHPNMKEIAKLAQEVLVENDLWNLIYRPNDKIK